MQDKNTYTVSPKWNLFILGLVFLRPFICEDSFTASVTGVVFGGGVCMFVYILCRGKGLGGGDVKLAAAGGAMLGGDILYALLIACVCAVFVQQFSVDKASKKIAACGKPHKYFAFVPYMSLGMEVVLLFQIVRTF